MHFMAKKRGAIVVLMQGGATNFEGFVDKTVEFTLTQSCPRLSALSSKKTTIVSN